MDLQLLNERHAPSVARSFKRFGIRRRPSPDSLFTAAVVHGEPFVNDLANQVAYDSDFVGFDGKANGEKVKKTLGDILTAVAAGLGTYVGTKAAATAPNNGTTTPVASKTKWILIAAVVAIVVFAIILFTSKKRS